MDTDLYYSCLSFVCFLRHGTWLLNYMTMAFAEALVQEMSPWKESHGDM